MPRIVKRYRPDLPAIPTIGLIAECAQCHAVLEILSEEPEARSVEVFRGDQVDPGWEIPCPSCGLPVFWADL